MKSAAVIGVKPSEFWNLTPVEMLMCGEAHENEMKAQFKSAMIAAWFNALWLRGNDMPTYNELVDALDGKTPEVKEMTDEEIFETIKVLNAAFGGEVIDSRKGGEVS